MTLTFVGKTPGYRASEILLSRCTLLPRRGIRLSKGHRLSSTSSTLEIPATSTSSTIPTSAAALSALPTKVLLRSLLVNTISSKPLLLNSALWMMSILSKPNRGFLLNVDRNPILHGILKKTFYEQFCAGENHAESMRTIKELKEMGFRGVIMTFAKETVFDHSTGNEQGLGVAAVEAEKTGEPLHPTTAKCASIEAWADGTLDTIDQLSDGDYIATKLTGAGPNVTKAFTAGELPPQQMMDALHAISRKAKERNVRIIVDAESHHFLAGMLRTTLDLMREYNRDGSAVIYMTYQAYLKETPDNIAKHLAAAQKDSFTLGLKLVRGAYIASDERSLIHDTKQDTDNAYNSIAQGALKQTLGDFGTKTPFPSVNLFLASHNKESVIAAHQLHKQRLEAGLPTVPVGYAQLHGMSDEVSFSLLALKDKHGNPEVFKCSTWGTMGECLAYLLRRAIENRDAVLRTTDEYDALKTEFKRRLRSAFALSAQR